MGDDSARVLILVSVLFHYSAVFFSFQNVLKYIYKVGLMLYDPHVITKYKIKGLITVNRFFRHC